MMLTVKSPLKAWTGSIGLPKPDDFSGSHWRVWKKAVNRPKRKAYALTHLYCYAGLELITVAGEWNITLPVESGPIQEDDPGTETDQEPEIEEEEQVILSLEEVQAWENAPEDERVKLVAWLGKTMMGYMDDIMDPKE